MFAETGKNVAQRWRILLYEHPFEGLKGKPTAVGESRPFGHMLLGTASDARCSCCWISTATFWCSRPNASPTRLSLGNDDVTER